MSDTDVFIGQYAQITVFDRTGSFKRLIGREGTGPGEFTRIVDIAILAGGKLAVFEGIRARLTVMDTLGTVFSDVLMPALISRNGAVVLPDTTLLLGGAMLERSRFGSPLVHATFDGQVLGYFGENEVEKEGFGRGRVLPRVFTYDSALGIVAVKIHKNVVETWNLADKTLINSIELQAPWFGPQPVPVDKENVHFTGAPESLFRAIEVDERGRIWRVAQVVPDDWERGVSNGAVVDQDAWTDTQIDVLDPRSNLSLCSARFKPSVMDGFVKPHHIASYREDDDGNPTISIWRLGT